MREFGATEWLGVSLCISYSQLGAEVDGELWEGMVNGDGANFYTAPMKVSSGIYSVVMRMDGHVYGDYLSFPLVANIYIPQVKGLSVKAGVQLGVHTSRPLLRIQECFTSFMKQSSL